MYLMPFISSGRIYTSALWSWMYAFSLETFKGSRKALSSEGYS
jgi:hypothetical protein